MKVVFLFIDGVGLSEPAADNPVNPEVCPALCRLIAGHSVPIDACLGVDGLPHGYLLGAEVPAPDEGEPGAPREAYDERQHKREADEENSIGHLRSP